VQPSTETPTDTITERLKCERVCSRRDTTLITIFFLDALDFQHENWAYHIHFEYDQKFREKVAK